MRKWFAVVAGLVLLTGCSTQLGYKFADTLIEWRLSEYVDLTSEQEQRIDPVIDELHLWHARSELPLYRQQLMTLRQRIANDELVEVDMQLLLNDAYSLWDRIRYQIEPYAQEFLPMLSAEQRQQVYEKLAEQLDERRERIAERTQEEAYERTQERLEENVESWLGSIRSGQRRYLARWLQERDDMRLDWLAYNERVQSEFRDVLENAEGEAYQVRLRELILDPQQFRSEQLQRQLVVNQAATATLMFELYQSMDDRQRRHLLRKIDGYIADLDDLIAYYAESE
ncbi:DUF6279 family lipoprotein [Pseudidiomarina aestuarii]|uniref:DUF6279 family lipoprotein n=1 Tax=Pseudidiomarina aestuarii TaxID=624146 RepID=UPI003A96DBA6